MAIDPENEPNDWDIEEDTPIIQSNFPQFQLPGTEWLPKTDWSRDGIIASDD